MVALYSSPTPGALVLPFTTIYNCHLFGQQCYSNKYHTTLYSIKTYHITFTSLHPSSSGFYSYIDSVHNLNCVNKACVHLLLVYSSYSAVKLDIDSHFLHIIYCGDYTMVITNGGSIRLFSCIPLANCVDCRI